jgi:hypothetical protein
MPRTTSLDVLPTFNADRPALYFARLEAIFECNKVATEKAKFNFAISIMEDRYAIEMEDIIRNPPTDQPYQRLKEAMLQRFTASQTSRLQRLLNPGYVGDVKPSALLRHFRSLCPEVPDEMLKHLWTSHLSTAIQVHVAAQGAASLEDLAHLADRLHEVLSVGPAVHSIAMDATTVAAAPAAAIAQPRATISSGAIEAAVAELVTEVTRTFRASRPHQEKRSRSNELVNDGLCWYHRQHGSQAKRCRPPCSMSGNAAGSK